MTDVAVYLNAVASQGYQSRAIAMYDAQLWTGDENFGRVARFYRDVADRIAQGENNVDDVDKAARLIYRFGIEVERTSIKAMVAAVQFEAAARESER